MTFNRVINSYRNNREKALLFKNPSKMTFVNWRRILIKKNSKLSNSPTTS